MNNTNIKTFIIATVAAAGILALASCAERAPDPVTHSSSTTTESSSIEQPVPATTETQTTRSY